MAANIPNLQFGGSPSGMSQFSQVSNMQLNPYQNNSIFMQPIGNIYGLNSSSDVGNIPIGSGVSMGLCLSEGTMYLKSMQNNGPVLLGYKLSPLETNQASGGPPQESLKLEQILKSFEERFAKLEKKLESVQSKGGKTEWQI